MRDDRFGPAQENGEGEGHSELWTRDGFNGASSMVVRPHYAPAYLSAQGLHVPRRFQIGKLAAPGSDDPSVLPLQVARSRGGVYLSVVSLSLPMPYVVRNVEADELHFVHHGELKFETDCGVLVASAGDFVCIPRSVAYRITPLSGPTQSFILESASPLRLNPQTSSGMINIARDVHYPRIEAPVPGEGETTLVLKAEDGPTIYRLPQDPLAAMAHVYGSAPVWKLNLANVQVGTYLPHGGPPFQFLTSDDGQVMLYTLSARITQRPPIHVNADFDEVVFYHRGPGAWGEVSEPGTVSIVPKGVIHQGPSEQVEEGYLAWLLETRPTLRLTPAALEASVLLETSLYGVHPSEQHG
ncbi:homogentisate 1,2-dioxygenase [Cupriavidus basilensis]|uniref:homogentisate 1,2-dioxygenase n=1 Tax=Cupriavidus basilensis TaxID=68895 RepID=UPI0005BC131C|nr:homogentisate 1,2-dioxygenase [Cupriavidus basilensis]